MSFLGGGPECSTSANPLNQFSKHVQDDKTLQRDRLVGRGPGGMQEGMRSSRQMGGGEGMVNDFMQNPSHMHQPQVPPIAMEQMRREFEGLKTGPAPQRPGNQHWAGEFGASQEESARMEAAFNGQRPAGFDSGEFQRFNNAAAVPQDMAHAQFSNPATMSGFQRPMGMGYGSMYGGMGMGGMGMGMGMGMGPMQHMQPQQADVKGKGKERMVELDDENWEAQFAELETHQQEDLDEEARQAMERELDQADRLVHHEPGAYDEFEKVWEKIKAETLDNLKNRDMFDDMDEGRWREHAGDFADWDGFDSTDLNTHLRDPQLGSYLFEEENIFNNVSDPFGEGVRIMDEGGNLSLAALAFEAAVQKDPSHVEAWTRLGAAQAQNEKESPAIRALEQALKLDPANLDALMGLAVSYTNEGYDSTAYKTLERWLSNKYPSVVPPESAGAGNRDYDPYSAEIGFTDRENLHKRVTDLFIQAAQLSPSPDTMDPDVQVGLGVLFYGAEEYDKAVDCFSSALASSERGSSNSEKANQRPLLWNRLGATLANSGRPEEAIQAYEKALELNPNFVRARYNLGVSCINIGCLAEAAQHLLGALSMHAVVEKEGRDKAKEILGNAAGGSGAGGATAIPDADFERLTKQNQSTNLYDTLRRVFGQMGRKDLSEKVVNGVDVDVFRGEFDF